MVYVYALQLEKEKYYIGKTVNPLIRLDDHFSSRGSHWTQKFKPLKCIELYENCNGFDEDVLTLRYMKEKGINNVRGGSFCEIYLNKNIMDTIQKMIQTHDDKCYRCGAGGHFANNCRNCPAFSQPNRYNGCKYNDKYSSTNNCKNNSNNNGYNSGYNSVNNSGYNNGYNSCYNNCNNNRYNNGIIYNNCFNNSTNNCKYNGGNNNSNNHSIKNIVNYNKNKLYVMIPGPNR